MIVRDRGGECAICERAFCPGTPRKTCSKRASLSGGRGPLGAGVPIEQGDPPKDLLEASKSFRGSGTPRGRRVYLWFNLLLATAGCCCCIYAGEGGGGGQP